jgi:hypothetical protein
VGQTITYTYTITNSGNVGLAGPFSVSDNILGTIACGSGPLAPGASTSCTATYTITQANLDAGSITNLATAAGNGVTSNQATKTVSAVQTAHVSLTKSASPATYTAAGQIVNYTLVAKNDGNVTLSNVSISDPKLGSLVCTLIQPAILSVGQSLSCTGSYTIQLADLSAGSVLNTATATGLGPASMASGQVSATASATVNGGNQPTGHVAETGTTCQQFKSGVWGYLDTVQYSFKDNKISSVSPGVFFYYNKVTAPASGGFVITVAESNNGAHWPIIPPQKDQLLLYDANCAKLSNVTVKSSGAKASLTVNGYAPGATYYFSVKYSPNDLTGGPAGTPPTVTYLFQTFINNLLQATSGATVNLAPKP